MWRSRPRTPSPARPATGLHAGSCHDCEAARETLRRAREQLLERAASLEDEASGKAFLENIPANARTMALAREWLG